MGEYTEEKFNEPKRPLTAGTTSNGMPWGHNIGKLGSAIFYGWSIKRGIESAQRRSAQPSDTPWTVPIHTASVAGQWVLFGFFLLLHIANIGGASIAVLVNYFDRAAGASGSVPKGTATLIIALTSSVFGVMMVLAARALMARAENLPPRRGERFLAWDLFPKTWLLLYVVTFFIYQPIYFVPGMFWPNCASETIIDGVTQCLRYK